MTNKEIKICVVSDNHGTMQPIRDLPMIEKDADYFLHCGDSREPVRSCGPYAQVRGNNDYYDVPVQKVLEIGDHRIFMTHGTRLVYYGNYIYLAKEAKKHHCDIALFGHTHMYADELLEGVRCLNPGSIWHNRDGRPPGYMIVTLNGQEITAEWKEYIPLEEAEDEKQEKKKKSFLFPFL